MGALTGRIALVTGASRGIGRAIALALAREGADVAVSFRSQEEAARRVEGEIRSCGRRCLAVQSDVSRSVEVSRLVRAVEEGLGQIGILVNNVGIARPQPPEAITERDWDELLTVNLKSVFLVSQAVLPGMRQRRWGRIINLSSAAAQVGGVVGPHYAASKAGIVGLTHSYASLLTKEGITVNAIAPALIETDLIAPNIRANPERIPVGRFGSAEEVATVAVMLATNGYITGQTVSINGGLYMT